jgi:dihydroxyacetone kinase
MIPCLSPSGSLAFESGVAAVSRYGGASAGHRTLLDALIPASTALKEVCKARDLDLP